ncbi:MAG TPA: ABC transporter ATP-binding protein [Tissierellia bacterium]|nr:ABC transporter ATP-binding protein [Tissierellia bacterium]
MNKNFKIFLKKYGFKKNIIPLYILIIFLIIISTVISIMRPKYQGILVDSLSNFTHLDKITFYKRLKFFLLILLLSYVVVYIQKYLTSLVSEEIASNLRQDVNNKLSTINNEYYHTHNFSDILLKVDKDIETIKFFGIPTIIKLVTNIATLVFVIPYMFYIDKKITVINLSLLLLIPLLSWIFGTLIQKTTRKVLDSYNSTTNVLNNNYANWKNILLFSCQNYVNFKYKENNQEYKRNLKHRSLLYTLNSALFLILQYGGAVAIWVLGSYKVFAGTMTIGTVLALMNYQSIIMNPIMEFSYFINDYHTAIESIEDLYQFYNYSDMDLGKVKLDVSPSLIRLENVSYSYNNSEEMVLKNISVEFEKGKVYAIIGKSGEGKSTLLQLISGFLTPTKGNIYINNVNLNDLNKKSYWSYLGYTMQRPKFFNDSIITNLNLQKNLSISEIQAKCKDIDIYDDIIGTDSSWDTIITTDTENFSEGQLKRLDISRNLLKKPSILLFDEATASLDAVRQAQFFDLIKDLSNDCIIILITHDMNEVKYVDEVYSLVNKELKSNMTLSKEKISY